MFILRREVYQIEKQKTEQKDFIIRSCCRADLYFVLRQFREDRKSRERRGGAGCGSICERCGFRGNAPSGGIRTGYGTGTGGRASCGGACPGGRDFRGGASTGGRGSRGGACSGGRGSRGGACPGGRDSRGGACSGGRRFRGGRAACRRGCGGAR